MKFRVSNMFKGRWGWVFLVFLCILVLLVINHQKLRQWTSLLIQKTAQIEGMDPNNNYSYVPDDGNTAVRTTFGVNDYLSESMSVLAFYKWRTSLTKPLATPTPTKTPYVSSPAPASVAATRTDLATQLVSAKTAPAPTSSGPAGISTGKSPDQMSNAEVKSQIDKESFVGRTEGMTLNNRTGDYRTDITKSKLYSLYTDYSTNMATQMSAIYDPIFKPGKTAEQIGLLAPLLRDFDKVYTWTKYFFLANPQTASSRVYAPNVISNYFTGLLQKYGRSSSNLATIEKGLITIMSQIYVFNQLYVDYINNPRQFFSPDDTCFLVNVAMDTIEGIDLSKVSKQGNGTIYMISTDNEDYTNTALNYDVLRISMANFVLSKIYNVSLANPNYMMSVDKFTTDYPVFVENNEQLQGIHLFIAENPPVFPSAK